MKSPTSIPFEEAKAWAEAHGQQSIIIVCRSVQPNLTHVLTWGETPAMSADAAMGGNRVKQILWPDQGPHNDKPAWLEALIKVYRAALAIQCGTAEENRALIESKIGK